MATNTIPLTKMNAVTNPKAIVIATGSEYKRQVLITAIRAIPPTDASNRPAPPMKILENDCILAIVKSPRDSQQVGP